MELIKTILKEHPYDWIAHLVLGFLTYLLNLYLIHLVFGFFAEFTALFCAANFIVAVELTQIDIFGLADKGQCTWYDYLIDLVCGGVGIWLATIIF